MTTGSTPATSKRSSLVEPAISASFTANGNALAILLTGLEVRLQDASAPLIATRTAAVVAHLDGAAAPAGAPETKHMVQHTLRGFTRATASASAHVLVVAGGRAVALQPKPDDAGHWLAEFALPLPDAADGAYPLAVTLVGTRTAVSDELLAVVDSIDLAVVASDDGAEDDPAAPSSRDADAGDAAGTRAANFGVDTADDDEAVSFDLTPTSLVLDMQAAQEFLRACMTSVPRVTYGLGAKVPKHGAQPGRDFQKVDCSGFVRELVWRSTTPNVNMPDGSVVQHEWVQQRGLAKGTPEEAMATDGVVRIAFLRPQDSPQGIGHVVIVHNGRTLESHGGVGPNSRPWTATGWQAKARVYRIPSSIA